LGGLVLFALAADGSLTNCSRADAGAWTNYPFLTQKERDNETNLDYFLARYYSSTQGRFTSPDEFKGGPDELWVLGSGDPEKQALAYAEVTNPQSLNKYQYCFNNPLRYVDPDGQNPQDSFENKMQQAIRDLNSGRINEQQYWDRLRGASVGTAAGLGVIAVALAGKEAGAAILLWASRNPDKLQQVAAALQEAGGGPPGAITGAVGSASKAELSIAKKLAAEGKNVEVLATGAARSADFAVNGIKAELKTLEGVGGVATSGTVKSAIGRALGQSGNVIIDASGVKLTSAEAQRGAARAFGADSRLKVVRIIGKDYDFTIARQQ
jgi:RHS repeat-associated protein